jgi:hypothetical protein
LKHDSYKYFVFALIFLIIFPFFKLVAQESSDVKSQVWMDYDSYRLPRGNLQFMGDAGFRFLVGGGWQRYIVRPSLQKSINEWLSLFGGLGFFFTAQKEISNTLEIRPWIGARLYWYWETISKIRFSNYTRIEGRFVINTQSSGTDISSRFRNKIDARIPITNRYFTDDLLYLMLSFEFFLEAGEIAELFADNIRLGVGLGYKFDYHWRVQFYFYGLRSQDTTTSGFTVTDQVWRLTVKHYID